MLARKLNQKPLLGAKIAPPPKSAVERAAERWFNRKKPPLNLRCTSGQLLKAEYIYNDQGQRTRKVNYQADGITVDSITIYHYDQMGYLVTETDEQGNLIKDYIWQEGMTPVAQIDNTLGTEQVIYLHTDHLMTNRIATDDFQTVVWRWEGEAFGNTQAQELAGFSVNLRFPGQYYDEETNLHYNWNRYYDPSLGRYITSDPIGLDGGNNTYGYALQNPLKYIDITGFKPLIWGPFDLGWTRKIIISCPSAPPDAKFSKVKVNLDDIKDESDCSKITCVYTVCGSNETIEIEGNCIIQLKMPRKPRPKINTPSATTGSRG